VLDERSERLSASDARAYLLESISLVAKDGLQVLQALRHIVGLYCSGVGMSARRGCELGSLGSDLSPDFLRLARLGPRVGSPARARGPSQAYNPSELSTFWSPVGSQKPTKQYIKLQALQ